MNDVKALISEVATALRTAQTINGDTRWSKEIASLNLALAALAAPQPDDAATLVGDLLAKLREWSDEDPTDSAVIQEFERRASCAAPRPQSDEAAWLIETDINSVLHYWTGRVIDGKDAGQWSHDVEKARRFSRREDASCMITWHLQGRGRAVEHLWVAPRPSGEREAPADLVTLVEKTQPLVREVFDSHRDKQSAEYNECESAECFWCESVRPFLAWRPSPPGERPAIEMGDWVQVGGKFGVRRLVTSSTGRFFSVLGRIHAVGVEEVQEIRKANGVIWRRSHERAD